MSRKPLNPKVKISARGVPYVDKETLIRERLERLERVSVQPHPLQLSIDVICNDCGRLMSASFTVPDISDVNSKQLIICVDRCKCDSPLIRDENG